MYDPSEAPTSTDQQPTLVLLGLDSLGEIVAKTAKTAVGAGQLAIMLQTDIALNSLETASQAQEIRLLKEQVANLETRLNKLTGKPARL